MGPVIRKLSRFSQVQGERERTLIFFLYMMYKVKSLYKGFLINE